MKTMEQLRDYLNFKFLGLPKKKTMEELKGRKDNLRALLRQQDFYTHELASHKK